MAHTAGAVMFPEGVYFKIFVNVFLPTQDVIV